MSPGELGLLLAAVTLAALVQGCVGFGMNLLLVPAVAVVVPEAIPAMPLALAVPLTIAMSVRDRRDIDAAALGWITLGRLPGTVVGAWLAVALAPDTLSAIAGATVVLAVAVSVLGPGVPVNATSSVVAGTASGVMGTSVSIGGPPLAILLQHRPGAAFRGTMSATFVVGGLLSMAALVVAGAVEGWHLRLALALVPGIAAGLVLSNPLRHRLDARWFRPAVLAVATVAGVVAVVRAL